MGLSAETKVGAFVIIGLALLLVGTLIVEDINPFREGHTLKVRFPSVEGLMVGNVVTIAGVECGKVKEMRLLPEEVEVILEIREGTVVREDDEATIALQTVLGGKMVAIIRGAPDAAPLKPGDEIKARIVPGLTDIAQGLGGDIETLLGAINQNQAEISRRVIHLLDENSEKVSNVISNIEEVTENIKAGRGTAGKILSDDKLHDEVVSAVASLRETSTRAKEIMDEDGAKLSTAVKNLSDITERIRSGEGAIGALIYDDKVRENIVSASGDLRELVASAKKTVSDFGEQFQAFAEAGPKVREAAEHLESVSRKIEEGEGTLGLLITDDSLYVEAKAMLAEIRGAMEDMREQLPTASFIGLAFSAIK